MHLKPPASKSVHVSFTVQLLKLVAHSFRTQSQSPLHCSKSDCEGMLKATFAFRFEWVRAALDVQELGLDAVEPVGALRVHALGILRYRHLTNRPSSHPCTAILLTRKLTLSRCSTHSLMFSQSFLSAVCMNLRKGRVKSEEGRRERRKEGRRDTQGDTRRCAFRVPYRRTSKAVNNGQNRLRTDRWL